MISSRYTVLTVKLFEGWEILAKGIFVSSSDNANILGYGGVQESDTYNLYFSFFNENPGVKVEFQCCLCQKKNVLLSVKF